MLGLRQFNGTASEYLRYSAVMEYMEALATKLGVVMYYPNYHGKRGDKNTVLFYTKEDDKHNRMVDKQTMQYSASAARDSHVTDEKYIYRDAFFAFESSDPNGFLSYDYANHGRIRLLANQHDRFDALGQAIRGAYAAKTGASAGIGEIDPKYGGVVTDEDFPDSGHAIECGIRMCKANGFVGG